MRSVTRNSLVFFMTMITASQSRLLIVPFTLKYQQRHRKAASVCAAAETPCGGFYVHGLNTQRSVYTAAHAQIQSVLNSCLSCCSHTLPSYRRFIPVQHTLRSSFIHPNKNRTFKVTADRGGRHRAVFLSRFMYF